MNTWDVLIDYGMYASNYIKIQIEAVTKNEAFGKIEKYCKNQPWYKSSGEIYVIIENDKNEKFSTIIKKTH